MLPHNSRYRMENLHGALLKLIEANFISRTVVGKTEHFSFVHNSVQEVRFKSLEKRLRNICGVFPGALTSECAHGISECFQFHPQPVRPLFIAKFFVPSSPIVSTEALHVAVEHFVFRQCTR